MFKIYNKVIILIMIIIVFCMTNSYADSLSYIWSNPATAAVAVSSNITEEYTNNTSNPLKLDCRISNINRTKYRKNIVFV